jgi:hypothetical protein
MGWRRTEDAQASSPSLQDEKDEEDVAAQRANSFLKTAGADLMSAPAVLF